jgi:hypothetical protein
MAETTNGESEQVKVGFVVELALLPPEESGDDFDAVRYCGELLLDALSGWGVGVSRIAHLEDPDRVFTT